jgi:hypothetical protein
MNIQDYTQYSDTQLLQLKKELVSGRGPVPLVLIKEIQLRNLQKPEQRELYGEYKKGQ